MNERAAKLAAARQKLKQHQEKNIRSEPTNDYVDSKTKFIPKNDKSSSLNPNILKNVEQNPILFSENYSMNNDTTQIEKKEDVSVTEILISNKTNLEVQVKELETQVMQLQINYNSAVEKQNTYMKTITHLEMELQTIHDNYIRVNEDILKNNEIISELRNKISELTDENNNLIEQLEFTKSVITTKENENSQLSNKICELQNELDGFQLQIKQLTNNSNDFICNDKEVKTSNIELYQKISNLEQQLQALQKDKDNINLHYEHYVNELNTQLKTLGIKNHELSQEINKLYHRENSLVDQITNMEIRLQSYQTNQVIEDSKDVEELKEKIRANETELQKMDLIYNELKAKYQESQKQIEILSKCKIIDRDQDNISISKLNADNASDKIAAQRATEQNKKLKTDLEELEFAFVKMSKDKLDLIEKLNHENSLNKELILKLAELEENNKCMHNKLMAKDEEMIRLQNSHRILEKNHGKLLESYKDINEKQQVHANEDNINGNSNQGDLLQQDHNGIVTEKNELVDSKNEEMRLCIAKEDAMLKLQERFLNIMDEVANLSDEKHRLEHIILQLQNETDTICEYIALYQQQRSLLKKRDEDRSEQIKLFQIESNKLKKQLEELTNLLLRFANDGELLTYLQEESRKEDLNKVMDLLTNLRNSSLISTNHKSLDFKNFYPCNCCSGQLMDV